MRATAIGTLTSVTTSTAMTLDKTPFLQGGFAVAAIHASTGAFSGSAKIQGSDDNSTWADIGTAYTTTGGGTQFVNISDLPKYLRLNCTAYTSGTVVATLLG